MTIKVRIPIAKIVNPVIKKASPLGSFLFPSFVSKKNGEILVSPTNLVFVNYTPHSNKDHLLLFSYLVKNIHRQPMFPCNVPNEDGSQENYFFRKFFQMDTFLGHNLHHQYHIHMSRNTRSRNGYTFRLISSRSNFRHRSRNH